MKEIDRLWLEHMIESDGSCAGLGLCTACPILKHLSDPEICESVDALKIAKKLLAIEENYGKCMDIW